MRQYTLSDRLIGQLDRALNLAFPTKITAYPQDLSAEQRLDQQEIALSEALMRVNHSGEIAAQALYHGQAAMARAPDVAAVMRQSAQEENDHLTWCKQRVNELGGHTSYLEPLWYAGSYGIGLLAGLVGDKFSLGFIAETERQVSEHLAGHLRILPEHDETSRKILTRMKADEERHGSLAMAKGGVELPRPVKFLMKCCAKVMTRTAFWI